MSWMGLRWLPGVVFQVSHPWTKVSQESLSRLGWESISSKTRPAGLEDPFPRAARGNSEMSWMGLPFPRAARGNSEMSWMGLPFPRAARGNSEMSWMGLPFPRAARGNSEMSWMGLVFCRSALSLSDYTPS